MRKQENTGEQKGEGSRSGRCGGWSETKNVSTSGRDWSGSLAVWLSPVCMTELPSTSPQEFCFLMNQGRQIRPAPPSSHLTLFNTGSEGITEVLTLCEVLCLWEGSYRVGYPVQRCLHIPVLWWRKNRGGGGFHGRHPRTHRVGGMIDTKGGGDLVNQCSCMCSVSWSQSRILPGPPLSSRLWASRSVSERTRAFEQAAAL